MADTDVKRLKYFKYQFLNAGDFEDEQTYHRESRKRHNRALHSPGIAEGLHVARSATDETQVVVSPGVAIDGNGQELVVAEERRVSLPPAQSGDPAVYLMITYHEDETDVATGAVAGPTRWTETPDIHASLDPPSGTLQILLATVDRTGASVASVDETTRPIAGAIPRADQVLSREIKEADGTTAQDTEIGSGIKTAHLQDGAVTTPKLADDAVTSGKLAPADGTSGQDVNGGAGVKTGHLQDAAVTGQKILDQSVPGGKLIDNSVQGGKLADSSVLGTKLSNLSVTGAKVADNSVPGGKLQDASVIGGKLADNSVQGAKLADNSVQGGKLVDNSVQGTKLVDNAVPGTKLQDLSVLGSKLADNAVPGTKLQDTSVAGGKLVDNSVLGTKLADNSVLGAKLTDNAVPGTKLQDTSVAGGKLVDNSVQGTKLADNAVSGTKLQDRSIPQTKHAMNSISLQELKTMNVVAYKMTVQLNPGVVSALTSPNGYAFLGVGLYSPKSAAFPDGTFTPTALSAWADPAHFIFNVVAVTPDPGVNVDGMKIEFGPVQAYYYSALGSPPAAYLGRQVQVTARAFGSVTAVVTPPFPNLTIHLSWTTVLPT